MPRRPFVGLAERLGGLLQVADRASAPGARTAGSGSRIGAVGSRQERAGATAARARSACAAGISRLDAGPRTSAKLVAARRAPTGSRAASTGSSCSVSRIAASWSAKPPSTAFEESTNSASRVSLRAELLADELLKLVIARAMFSRRSASASPISRQVAAERLEAPQARRELLAAAAEALAGALEQQLQVGAGVAVERREDLVGLHVGLGLRERDRRRPRASWLVLGARVELDRSCPGGRCAGAAAPSRRRGSAARTAARPASSPPRGRPRARRR